MPSSNTRAVRLTSLISRRAETGEAGEENAVLCDRPLLYAGKRRALAAPLRERDGRRNKFLLPSRSRLDEKSSESWGRADLHVHSRFSPDGFSSLKKILQRAKNKGLDIVAICDHDTIEGAKEAKKMAPEFGMEVIVGQEINTKEGHLLALFVKERIPPRKAALETIKEIHQQGGLAVVPHPDNWPLGGIQGRVLFKIFDILDGIEVFNGAWRGELKRKRNKKLNDLVFNLASLGGSDAHLASQVGCAFTFFQGKTPADLYNAIEEKLTLPGGTSWQGKDRFLWLVNTPRVFYKNPQMPLEGTYRMFKRILTPHLLTGVKKLK